MFLLKLSNCYQNIFFTFKNCLPCLLSCSVFPLLPLNCHTSFCVMTLPEFNGGVQNVPQIHKNLFITSVLLHRFNRVSLLRITIKVQKRHRFHQWANNHFYVTSVKITLKSSVGQKKPNTIGVGVGLWLPSIRQNIW